MRLLSWDVAGRVRRLEEQAARVAELAPDLVCEQEVAVGTAPAWVEHCEYLHGWRRAGLSDHSPLLARLSRRS